MAEAMSITEQLKEKVATLSAALLDKHPSMPLLLRDIHKTVKQYPEQMTMLAEEEIATIFAGLMKQTDTEFAVAAQKGSGSKSALAKIKAAGADAF